MTERTLSELANAEIVPDMGGPNAWLVRFGEEDYDTVNKSGKNSLLVKDKVSIADTVSYGGIMVDFNLQSDDITLHDGDNGVRVPSGKHESVLWAVYDEDGPRLEKLFNELYTPTVRKGLMDQFMPRFRQEKNEIQKSEDGWLVRGDILVSWDGSNHPVSVSDTHVVRGGDAVPADEDKEAREIQMPSGFDSTDEFEVTAPDGRTFTLDGVEVRFLTTVGLILDRNPSHYDDALSSTIERSEIVGFTDTKSGLHHGHSEGKHQIQDLGVTDECADMLWSNANDHTPLHEMSLREKELKNAPIDVFEDAPNDDPSKWQKIHNTKEKAPIPKHIRRQLKQQFE